MVCDYWIAWCATYYKPFVLFLFGFSGYLDKIDKYKRKTGALAGLFLPVSGLVGPLDLLRISQAGCKVGAMLRAWCPACRIGKRKAPRPFLAVRLSAQINGPCLR